MALRGLKIAGWLIIAGGMLVSAARVVMALSAQAFDQVASAGFPAIVCLAGGALVLVIANVAEDARASRALGGQLLKDLCPTQPSSLIGLLLLLGGLGWIAYVYWTLNEASVRAWAIIPASFGGIAALVGVILMVMAGVRGPRRDH